MFSVQTDLMNLKYNIENMDLVEMMLEILRYQNELESRKAPIRYGTYRSVYNPAKVRGLIRAATAQQTELHGKCGDQKHEGVNGGDHINGGQQGKSKGKSRTCFVCGSEEHFEANCPDKDNKQGSATSYDQTTSKVGNERLVPTLPRLKPQQSRSKFGRRFGFNARVCA